MSSQEFEFEFSTDDFAAYLLEALQAAKGPNDPLVESMPMHDANKEEVELIEEGSLPTTGKRKREDDDEDLAAKRARTEGTLIVIDPSLKEGEPDLTPFPATLVNVRVLEELLAEIGRSGPRQLVDYRNLLDRWIDTFDRMLSDPADAHVVSFFEKWRHVLFTSVQWVDLFAIVLGDNKKHFAAIRETIEATVAIQTTLIAHIGMRLSVMWRALLVLVDGRLEGDATGKETAIRLFERMRHDAFSQLNLHYGQSGVETELLLQLQVGLFHLFGLCIEYAVRTNITFDALDIERGLGVAAISLPPEFLARFTSPGETVRVHGWVLFMQWLPFLLVKQYIDLETVLVKLRVILPLWLQRPLIASAEEGARIWAPLLVAATQDMPVVKDPLPMLFLLNDYFRWPTDKANDLHFERLLEGPSWSLQSGISLRLADMFLLKVLNSNRPHLDATELLLVELPRFVAGVVSTLDAIPDGALQERQLHIFQTILQETKFFFDLLPKLAGRSLKRVLPRLFHACHLRAIRAALVETEAQHLATTADAYVEQHRKAAEMQVPPSAPSGVGQRVFEMLVDYCRAFYQSDLPAETDSQWATMVRGMWSLPTVTDAKHFSQPLEDYRVIDFRCGNLESAVLYPTELAQAYKKRESMGKATARRDKNPFYALNAVSLWRAQWLVGAQHQQLLKEFQEIKHNIPQRFAVHAERYFAPTKKASTLGIYLKKWAYFSVTRDRAAEETLWGKAFPDLVAAAKDAGKKRRNAPD